MRRISISLIIIALFLVVHGICHAAPKKGLVAYWSFNYCTAKDFSGNAYDGTIYGNPTCVDGAFSFDGQDDYIAFSEEVFGPSVDAFTFSTWVNANSEDYLPEKIIIYKGSYNGEALLCTYDNSFFFLLKLSDEKWYMVSAPMIKNAKVNLTAVYRRGDRIELWVNGKLSSSLAVPDLDLFTEQYHFSSIGAYSQNMYSETGWGLDWDGIIDEVSIYNRALSKGEIQVLYMLYKVFPAPFQHYK